MIVVDEAHASPYLLAKKHPLLLLDTFPDALVALEEINICVLIALDFWLVISGYVADSSRQLLSLSFKEF